MTFGFSPNANRPLRSGIQIMSLTFILYVRKGNAATAKSNLPTLYRFKDIGFEEFEDFTEHDTKSEPKEHAIDTMRWYSAGKGLKMFLEIKARIAAGERFELPRETVTQVSKEVDMAVKDLTQPAKHRLQFHLAWSE